MEKYQIYNQLAKEIVKNYNAYLHIEDVKILTSPNVDPHFTISHIIDQQLANRIHSIALELKNMDNSLIINSPENYHITLFWSNLESKLDTKIEEIQAILGGNQLRFSVENMLFGPLGISVKFYPCSEDFVKIREKIYTLTDLPFNIDERSVTTWVNIAAYSQIPKIEVKEFVQKNANISFGDYEATEFTLYISDNKGLVNPKKIHSFHL